MTTEYEPSHIPLMLRKALSGRSLFIEAAALFRLDFTAQNASLAFSNLEQDLFNRAAETSPNTIPLDRFLENLCIEIEQRAEVDAKKPHGNLVKKLVAEMKHRAGKVKCSSCSPLSPRVCDGGQNDHDIVHRGGQCIESFRSMFDFALRIATEYYEKIGKIPSVLFPKVFLSTRLVNSPPNDIPGNYFVNGVTYYEAAGDGGSRSIVKLEVYVDKFDWNTYLVVPYVMFHECISHAFYSLSPASGNNIRKSTGPDDPFAEGWMDLVAYEVMKEVLQGRSVIAIQPSLAFLTDHLDTGTRCHLSRANINDAPGTKKSQHAIQRAVGRDAADKFRFLMERLPESSNQAWSEFLHFSFNLNAGSFTASALSTFVWKLRRLLPSRGELVKPYQVEPIPQLLREYFEKRDLKTLVASINAI
jgi:hypothetical protein